MDDYYQILEVKPNASQDQIKNQYRFLVQAWHPDKFGSPESKAKAEEKLKQINEAFNVLKDPIKRDQYDRQRQYSQKGYDHQAQDDYERQRYEQEARAKTRHREQAEAQRREQEARAKAEEERRPKDHTDPKRREEETRRRRETKPIGRWAWVIFVLFLFWLGARAFSPSSPTAFEAATEAPLAATESPTEAPDATMISDSVTMLLIPAGEFTMGSKAFDDEQPIHTVYLPDYYIDEYEVTNAAYKRCVDVGICGPPAQSDSSTRSAYYGNPEFDDYPVIYVDWNMANTYCLWRDARLPSEAEWEKAARGADGRTYPWGENIDCGKANYQSSCVGDTTKVSSYLNGVSPYGIYDMAGNVWEWVNDWYDEKYFQSSPSSNPLGAASGQYRVLRGGSWLDGDNNARSAKRHKTVPVDIYFSLGFRCSRSP